MHAGIGNRSGFDALEFFLLSEHQNGPIEPLHGVFRVLIRNKLHAHLNRVRIGDVKYHMDYRTGSDASAIRQFF